MKYSSIIAMAAAIAALVVPASSATPEMDEAVQYASRGSKAGLDAICAATYKAVKASPDEADRVFEAVLGQRADWKASEVYAIFRSVLLARPDLIEEINTLVNAHRSSGRGGKNGKNSGDNANGDEVGAVTKSSTISPMLARLVNVLYDAALNPGVAEEAFNMVVAAVAGTYAFAYQSAFNQIGDNTNMEGPSLDVLLEFIVTPEPMTKH